VRRIDLDELQRVQRWAKEKAEVADELANRLDKANYVVVTWTTHKEWRHCLCGASSECRAVILATLKDACDEARSFARTLDRHGIKHSIKLPNVRELRKKYGGGA